MVDLAENPFKAAIARGEQQIGMWCSVPDSGYAEMIATCGYDWMLIDAEHAPMGLHHIQSILQALAAYPTHPIVRPAWNDPVQIKRLLDIGAQTLLIPFVQNAAEAAQAVAATRYPPKGIRGVNGLTRAARYGQIPDYMAQADDQICVLVQIETGTALPEIEAIAAVEGVDGIFIGPADLAASMGYPGGHDLPQMRATVLDALRRIRAAGKPAGIVAVDEGFLAEAVLAGSNFTAVGIDVAVLVKSLNALRGRWS